jgi:Leucine-rich repeat (LRR) protein
MRFRLPTAFLLVAALLPAIGHAQTSDKRYWHPDEVDSLMGLSVAGFRFSQAHYERVRQLFAPNRTVLAKSLEELSDLKALQSISFGEHPTHFEVLPELPYLPNMKGIDVSHPLQTHSDMSWLKRVPNLEGMNLEAPKDPELLPESTKWKPGVSDSAVAELRALKELQVLRLNGQQVTAEGLAALTGLEKLHFLELNDTPVDDRALTEIAKLQGIKTLNLARTQITDKGIAELGKLPHLEMLTLDETKITDKGLANIDEFPKLRSVRFLYLENTRITNEGMKSIAKLESLAVLNISNTRVSEEGLKLLAGRSKLYCLAINNLRVHEETVTWLLGTLPNHRNAIRGYVPH